MSFRRSLYILDNSRLPGMSSANTFSQSMTYLLSLLTFSLAEQFLMKSSFSVLSFTACPFGVISKKCITCPRSSRFSSVASWDFCVLHLAQRSILS